MPQPHYSSSSMLISLILFQCYFVGADETEDIKQALKTQAFRKKWEMELTACTPQHVHISLCNESPCMKIMWATYSQCEDCEILYGMNTSAMQSRTSTNYTYFTQHNKKGLQHLYLVELQSLDPNTTYYYRPVCGNQTSGPYYFHVPPDTSDWVGDYLVFGDMGVQSQSVQTVVEEAQSGQYTAVIHAGDFAYNIYGKGGQTGDEFMEMIEPAASFVPYMTCPGNHEIEDGDKFSHYRHRFAMPDSDWPTPLDKMWYSFDLGPVHFISYSSEVFFTNDGKHVKAQEDWLLQDLALANSRRNVTPWIIAFGHRPLYCSTRIGDDCSQDTSLVRLGFEKIFYEQKVDVLLQAHEHNYERLWPVYQDKITDYSYTNVKSPIQIITGAAGSHYGTDHFTKGDQPKWSAFRVGEPALNSYGRMLVSNRTHIWWEQRSALDHSVIDGVWIIKEEGFDRSINMTYIFPQPEGSFLIMGVIIFCIALVSLVFIIGLVIQIVRRRKFNKTWHSPLAQDDYMDDDDYKEEEEFSQHSYRSSLL